MEKEWLKISEPVDYFSGVGRTPLPTPTSVLLFLRETRSSLQQEALQNRSHHRFVLARNLETEGHVHLDHLTMPLKPGQAILILPYQFHHFSLLAANRLKWLFCTFELQPRTFLEPLRNRVLDLGSKTLALYEQLLVEWHAPHEELQAEQLQAVLLRLLLSLKQDRLRSAADLPPVPEDSLLQTINRLLAERSGRPVVVADLAEALNYSESRLRAIFKEAAGVPLGSYIQNHRIHRAMALLRTTKLPVAAVAEEAGFGSPQAFSRIFKQSTGLTPRSYRTDP
ncbi:helix-turn-helix transcriptional regulator [Pontiella sp.]|uniref:helix-turn-helix transcriptional regulator n=1 Tax=Pontiella sp. TaxID=2837462 RepID=UPI003569F479